MILEDAVATCIAERSQFAQQHSRRYPVWRRRLYSSVDVLRVRIELAPSRLTPGSGQAFAPKIAPNRIARHLEHSRDLANAFSPPTQGPGLPRFLRHQHEALHSRVPHAGVGQFSIGDPGSVLH